MLDGYARRFEQLYRGLQRAHGTYRISGPDAAKKGKMGGKAVTLFEPPTLDKWQDHLSGGAGLGIVPINESNQCRWGAIDVDVYKDGLLEEIEEHTRQLKLPLVCIRTKSGGAHITAYVSEPLDARMMRAKMTEFAAALGYAGVEIYPKQVQLASERDAGNWLNMPYFDAEKTTRYAIYKGQPLSVSEFLDFAEALRIDPHAFLALSCSSGDHFADGPPCLQTLAKQGIGAGMRNEGLFAMGVYVRMKYPNGWEDEVDKLNQLFVTPPLPSREVQAVCKSLSRKEYFYTCTKQPIVSFCNKALCLHREYGVGQGDNAPSLDLGRLVKLCTTPPSWIIDVEGVRFELETEELMSQAKFAKACVDRINKWPPPVKPNVWQQLIQARLDDAEIIEAPEEASPEGRFLWHLEQFCVISAPARVREELLLGKPWTENGRTYFRSEDMMRYMVQHNFRDITPRKAWALLRNKVGARHEQFQLKGRCTQCWSVPEYHRQSAEFEPIHKAAEF